MATNFLFRAGVRDRQLIEMRDRLLRETPPETADTVAGSQTMEIHRRRGGSIPGTQKF